LPSAIAIAVAITHCRHHHRCIAIGNCLLLPLPLAIAISVTIGYHSRHLHQPSLLPLLSAIAKSCCLGATRIAFEQFKQIMLTSFYFVWTVGGALIKAG
jgi:hypothetical protein